MDTLDTPPLNVLYVETFATGSHGRILDLLRRNSSLAIDAIRCTREHWRWLAIAAHYEVLDNIKLRENQPPDLILCSGPLNLGALVALLPESWREIPRVVYFHESQWTYPSPPNDPRPYVLAHLDAVNVADEAWFNSRYHLDTFWTTATSSAAPDRVRALATRLRPSLENKCRVVYPPVTLDTKAGQADRQSRAPSVLWNARWETDKRPDRFVQLLGQLATRGCEFTVTILGTGSTDITAIAADLGTLSPHCLIPGHLESRSDYESMLGSADVFISTADHEFFGVSSLESALAGVRPVLPNTLAYPETLPSAYFYEPGNVDELTRITTSVLHQTRTLTAHRSDAARYTPKRTVAAFDQHCRRVVAKQRT